MMMLKVGGARTRIRCQLPVSRARWLSQRKNTQKPGGGIWDAFKSEVSNHGDLSNAMNSLKDRANKAAKKTIDFAEKSKSRISSKKILNGENERTSQFIDDINASTKSAVKRLRSTFSDLLSTANATVDRVYERIDPKVVDSATRMTEKTRAIVNKIVTPTSGAASRAADIVKESMKELFPSREGRVYSQRDIKRQMEEKAKETTAETTKTAQGATPLGTPSTETAITIVKKKESEWQKHRRVMMEKLEKLPMYRKLSDAVSGVKKQISETTVYQKGSELNDRVSDKVEDIRDHFETTQNPVVWAVRDSADTVFAETDSAATLAEIRRIDPNFSLPLFMEEMEEYMIPKFVKAYLQADMDILRQACSGDALRNMVAIFQQRSTLGHVYDDRILDISDVNFSEAITLENSDPVLLVTFKCQHVNCVRDLKGNIVEGSEHEIKSTFYSCALKRDLENPDFNWRVVEISVQGITALI